MACQKNIIPATAAAVELKAAEYLEKAAAVMYKLLKYDVAWQVEFVTTLAAGLEVVEALLVDVVPPSTLPLGAGVSINDIKICQNFVGGVVVSGVLRVPDIVDVNMGLIFPSSAGQLVIISGSCSSTTMDINVFGKSISFSGSLTAQGIISNGVMEYISVTGLVEDSVLPPLKLTASYSPALPSGSRTTWTASLLMASLTLEQMLSATGLDLSFLPAPLQGIFKDLSFSDPSISMQGSVIKLSACVSIFVFKNVPIEVTFITSTAEADAQKAALQERYQMAGVATLPQDATFAQLGEAIPVIRPLSGALDELLQRGMDGSRLTFATEKQVKLPVVTSPTTDMQRVGVTSELDIPTQTSAGDYYLGALAQNSMPGIPGATRESAPSASANDNKCPNGSPPSSMEAGQASFYNIVNVGGGFQFSVNLQKIAILKPLSGLSGISTVAISASWIDDGESFSLSASFLGYKQLCPILGLGNKKTADLFDMAIAVMPGQTEVSLTGYSTLTLGGETMELMMSATVGNTIDLTLEMQADWSKPFGIPGLTILPSGIEVGLTPIAEFPFIAPSTFILATGIKIGVFSGTIALVVPDLEEDKACFEATVNDLNVGTLVESLIPSLKLPASLASILNAVSVKSAGLYFSTSPLVMSFMDVTCTGPGATLNVDDFKIVGLVTANVSFAMTDQGFSMSGSATPFKVGPLSLTGATSANPSVSLKVMDTDTAADSFAISARVQLFGLSVAISAQLSFSQRLSFAATVNLGILSMSLDFATAGALSDPSEITFSGTFKLATLPSLEASIKSGVKALSKDLAKLVPNIKLRRLLAIITEPSDELQLVVDDTISNPLHSGRQLLGGGRRRRFSYGALAHGAKTDSKTVANVATHDTHTVVHGVKKDSKTVANVATHDADALATSVENTEKAITEIKLNSIAVSGDLNMAGGPSSFSLEISIHICGKTHHFDFTLNESSLTPKGLVDSCVNFIKGDWKQMC